VSEDQALVVRLLLIAAFLEIDQLAAKLHLL
jgi:hypothetical protein